MTRHILSVQITDSLAARLTQHAKQTLIPTSAFVRFAVESALGNPVIEAELQPVQKVKPIPLLAVGVEYRDEQQP